MARHNIWEPGPDDPTLLEWYEPLVELGRRARAERIHWPVLVEDFELVRRVDRQSAPRVWTYRHRGTEGELHVDDAGATYAYRPHPSAGAGGRFVATPIRRAVYAAELHRQPEDLWYEFPGERRQQQAAYAGSFEPPMPEVHDHDRPGAHAPRRRRHLVLVPSAGD
jgi:hypothetical protein